MKTSGIYGIFNTANGKVLIGSSSHIEARRRVHLRQLVSGAHPNPHLQASWTKYGAESFEFRIVEVCPEGVLLAREDAWMQYHDSLNCDRGYNMQSARKTFIRDEVRLKQSLAHLGKKLPEEQRRKMSEVARGVKKSPEHCKHISEGLTGIKRGAMPEIWKKKISDANKGRPANNKGKPMSAEQRQKLSEIHKLRHQKLREQKEFSLKIA